MTEAPSIPVKVGGIDYPTRFDTGRGHAGPSQRFVEVEGLNYFERTEQSAPVPPAVAELAKTNKAAAWVLKHRPTDLNDMAGWYGQDAFPQRDYVEFYMAIGYSVGGLCDLSFFMDMVIENPAWYAPAVPLLWAFGAPTPAAD